MNVNLIEKPFFRNVSELQAHLEPASTVRESIWFDENDYEHQQDKATTDRFSWEKGGAHVSY